MVPTPCYIAAAAFEYNPSSSSSCGTVYYSYRKNAYGSMGPDATWKYYAEQGWQDYKETEQIVTDFNNNNPFNILVKVPG